MRNLELLVKDIKGKGEGGAAYSLGQTHPGILQN